MSTRRIVETEQGDRFYFVIYNSLLLEILGHAEFDELWFAPPAVERLAQICHEYARQNGIDDTSYSAEPPRDVEPQSII